MGRKKAQAPKLSEKEQSRAALLEDELFGRPSFAVDENAEEKTTSSLEDPSQPLFVIDAEGLDEAVLRQFSSSRCLAPPGLQGDRAAACAAQRGRLPAVQVRTSPSTPR